MGSDRLIFRLHAVRRMFERGVSEDDIRDVLAAGETIEDYPTDFPLPSRLILGWIGSRPLHLVVARNAATVESIIITVYEPGLDKWNPDYRTRRP